MMEYTFKRLNIFAKTNSINWKCSFIFTLLTDCYTIKWKDITQINRTWCTMHHVHSSKHKFWNSAFHNYIWVTEKGMWILVRKNTMQETNPVLQLLTFKVRMLGTPNAACTAPWPIIGYTKRRACIKFFSSHGVYLSKKPKQTQCGLHKAWYSSGAMMSFMAVRVSMLFMCTLDLWGSAEGVTGTTQ